MNVIIPMAGMGKRLRPLTLTTPKPFIKVAGKSIVQRILESLINLTDENITDVSFVIGNFQSTYISQLKELGKKFGFNTHIFYQKEALGTAHALTFADTFLKNKVIIAYADTLFLSGQKLDSTKDVVILTKKVENPQQYGVVVKQGEKINSFAEKPEKFVSNEAIIGIYYFKEACKLKQKINYLIETNTRGNGEYQLTDALQLLLNDSVNFYSQNVDKWLDCGNVPLLLQTTAEILKHENPKFNSANNSTIIPPVYISENVEIENSVIGPYVSVEQNTKISNSVITNSVIYENSVLTNSCLKNSVVGNHSNLNNAKNNLILGDHSEIL